MCYQNLVLFLVVFLSLSPRSQSWGWFSSSSDASSSEKQSVNIDLSKGLVAEFSVDALNDPKAAELLENAKRKLGGTNKCWFRAYQDLFSTCSDIFAAEEKRKRLAWHLSDCFQKDSGRNSFPSCGIKTAMLDCLRKLNNDDHKTYLEFYLQTNSICHQLQLSNTSSVPFRIFCVSFLLTFALYTFIDCTFLIEYNNRNVMYDDRFVLMYINGQSRALKKVEVKVLLLEKKKRRN